MIIAMSGYAQSGKDTAAAVLVEKYGFVRYAFATALKEMVYRLNPIVLTEMTPDNLPHGGPEPYLVTHRVQDYVDMHGWEQAKKVPEIRRLLQVMGTEAGRQVLGDNIWVDAVMNKITGEDHVVVTDCRFPNEAEAVKVAGGFVVRVDRPGVEAVNAHPSETALDGWNFDAYINNYGTLEDLNEYVCGLYESLENHHLGLTLF